MVLDSKPLMPLKVLMFISTVSDFVDNRDDCCTGLTGLRLNMFRFARLNSEEFNNILSLYFSYLDRGGAPLYDDIFSDVILALSRSH